MGPFKFIDKTLNTTIAPMVYIMMFVNMIIGFCFATGFGLTTGYDSILYNSGVLISHAAWGAILFITASTAEFGMIKKIPQMMQFGGIFGFMVWLFACISLVLAGRYYVLATVGLFHLLFHGYVYLATTAGYIFRSPN